MKLLVFDQSTRASGYSIWENKKLSEYGTLIIEDSDKYTPYERIREMYFMIRSLLDTEKPNFVSLEGVQFQNSHFVHAMLSELRGTIVAQLFERDIGFIDVPPTKWKSFCKIKGCKREEQKANTIQMVKELYDLDCNEDEADAIGQGIYVSSILKWK